MRWPWRKKPDPVPELPQIYVVNTDDAQCPVALIIHGGQVETEIAIALTSGQATTLSNLLGACARAAHVALSAPTTTIQ